MVHFVFYCYEAGLKIIRFLEGYDPNHKLYLLELFDKAQRGDSHLLIGAKHRNAKAGPEQGAAGLLVPCVVCLPTWACSCLHPAVSNLLGLEQELMQ